MALKDSQIIKYCANNFTFSDKKNFQIRLRLILKTLMVVMGEWGLMVFMHDWRRTNENNVKCTL